MSSFAHKRKSSITDDEPVIKKHKHSAFTAWNHIERDKNNSIVVQPKPKKAKNAGEEESVKIQSDKVESIDESQPELIDDSEPSKEANDLDELNTEIESTQLSKLPFTIDEYLVSKVGDSKPSNLPTNYNEMINRIYDDDKGVSRSLLQDKIQTYDKFDQILDLRFLQNDLHKHYEAHCMTEDHKGTHIVTECESTYSKNVYKANARCEGEGYCEQLKQILKITFPDGNKTNMETVKMIHVLMLFRHIDTVITSGQFYGRGADLKFDFNREKGNGMIKKMCQMTMPFSGYQFSESFMCDTYSSGYNWKSGLEMHIKSIVSYENPAELVTAMLFALAEFCVFNHNIGRPTDEKGTLTILKELQAILFVLRGGETPTATEVTSDDDILLPFLKNPYILAALFPTFKVEDLPGGLDYNKMPDREQKLYCLFKRGTRLPERLWTNYALRMPDHEHMIRNMEKKILYKRSSVFVLYCTVTKKVAGLCLDQHFDVFSKLYADSRFHCNFCNGFRSLVVLYVDTYNNTIEWCPPMSIRRRITVFNEKLDLSILEYYPWITKCMLIPKGIHLFCEIPHKYVIHKTNYLDQLIGRDLHFLKRHLFIRNGVSCLNDTYVKERLKSINVMENINSMMSNGSYIPDVIENFTHSYFTEREPLKFILEPNVKL